MYKNVYIIKKHNTDHFQTCGHIGYTNNHINTNNNNKSHTHTRPYLHNHSSSSALLSNEYTNNNDSNMHTIIEVNNDDNKYDENNKFKKIQNITNINIKKSNEKNIIETNEMAEDVQGATLLAVGSSSPELLTALLGVIFYPDDMVMNGKQVLYMSRNIKIYSSVTNILKQTY